MQTPPPGLEIDDLRHVLLRGWGIAAEVVEHVPLGFGSHHWAATALGVRWFVTVDAVRAGSVDALEAAFRTAQVLHDRAGLAFVVGPVPSPTGEVVRPVGDDLLVSVWPWQHLLDRPDDQTAEVVDQERAVDLLARLHEATPAVEGVVRVDDLALDERDHLERRLARPDETWADGPYSARAQTLLASHRDAVLSGLRAYDRLASSAAAGRSSWVVTHGEPHPGNLLRTPDGLVLVDWDTALLAPAARDLWAAGGRDDAAPVYAERTGHEVPAEELELYSLRWELTDAAEYVRWFADPHADDEDSATAWTALQEELAKLAARPG